MSERDGIDERDTMNAALERLVGLEAERLLLRPETINLLQVYWLREAVLELTDININLRMMWSGSLDDS